MFPFAFAEKGNISHMTLSQDKIYFEGTSYPRCSSRLFQFYFGSSDHSEGSDSVKKTDS